MIDIFFSKKKNVDSGVSQGTVLGPLLIELFANDLACGLSIRTRTNTIDQPIKLILKEDLCSGKIT